MVLFKKPEGFGSKFLALKDYSDRLDKKIARKKLAG
jgi:hypothetical protein